MPTNRSVTNSDTPSLGLPAEAAHGSESRHRAWGLTSLLVLLYVVNYADKAVFGIIAQPLADDLGLRSSQIGLVGSLFFVTFTIGGFFAGALNRWLTLRWALMLLALIWAVAMLPLVAAATFTVLIVSRMLLGFAEGPSSALLHTAAYSWHAPARRGLPGALLAGAASIAKIAVAPVLALITVNIGWRAALVTLAIAGVVWCVIWLSTWTEGPYISGTQRPKTNASNNDSTGDDAPENAGEPAVPWSRIFASRTFIGGVLVVMSVYALVTVVLTWLPSYFEKGLGYSRLESGSMFALPSIVGLVLMLITSIASDRLVARGATSRAVRIIVPSLGVLIAGILLFMLPSVATPWVAVMLISLGYGFAATVFPLFNAAVSEICPPRQIAGTLGVFLAIMAIGGLIAPYATGVIVDAAATPAEGYASAFQIIGIVAAVSAIIALAIVNPERDKLLVRGAAFAADGRSDAVS